MLYGGGGGAASTSLAVAGACKSRLALAPINSLLNVNSIKKWMTAQYSPTGPITTRKSLFVKVNITRRKRHGGPMGPFTILH